MKNKKTNFFRKKRILITGITGFVGSNLAKRLTELGADVYGISRSRDGGKNIKGNVANSTLVNNLINRKKIQICFHLAGESIVEKGQSLPYKTFRTNILGTLSVLEAARKNKIERVIVSSSSHVYGENKLPYLEEYFPSPSRPYETSKASNDLITMSYANTFNVPVLIPRFVNIYGPGDVHFGRLIPKTMRDVLRGKYATMWGGKSLRNYLYIEDAIDAYLMLASVDMKKTNSNRIFNIGSNSLISVEDLIKKIIMLSGKKILIKKIPRKRELEIKSQYVSWEKAKEILKWEPKFDLDSGLQKTYIWYLDYFSGKK